MRAPWVACFLLFFILFMTADNVDCNLIPFPQISQGSYGGYDPSLMPFQQGDTMQTQFQQTYQQSDTMPTWDTAVASVAAVGGPPSPMAVYYEDDSNTGIIGTIWSIFKYILSWFIPPPLNFFLGL